jgi:hypothetical protein
MPRHALSLLALAIVLVLSASATYAQQADLTAAQALGFTGPITAEQGAAIAARHTGAASARLVEQETERGVLLLEYLVETSKGVMEVEVRQADGAVLEVEPADEDDAEDDDGEDDDDGTDDDE